MDANDVAEAIRETVAEQKAEDERDDRFRSRVALIIATLAALLAISSVGGDNVGEALIVSNIHASDTWAFYQAKNVRQTVLSTAADAMETDLALRSGGIDAGTRATMEKRIAGYRATIARYDSEPDRDFPTDSTRGEGKKQLAAKARLHEAERARAEEQDASFDYADALFQIAIVLGSVAILALSRKVLAFSIVAGSLATLLMLNGYLMLFMLPF